ncbi:hypothetical protein D3C73_1479200 [compost metagenome]
MGDAEWRSEDWINGHLAFHIEYIADELLVYDIFRLALCVNMTFFNSYDMMRIPAGEIDIM